MADFIMEVDIPLGEVPVNLLPLLDDTDFKSRETAVAFNAAGMDLVWNFTTTEGATTQTAVTPTSGGAYDWAHQGDGMYTIEIPASGGASINNNATGCGWFTGIATGVLAWRGPTIQFSPANVVNALVNGTDKLQVHADEITNNLITAAAIATGAIDADAIADNAIDAGALAADCITAAKIADNAIDAGAIAANAITSAKIATDAIGSAQLAATAVTEIQSGLATAADLATVAGYLDTEIAAILADTNELQADWANGGRLDLILDARASQASVDTIDDFLDTEIAAIKAKTDTLPADPADASDIAALIDALPTAAENAAALLDLANGIETSITPRQAIRLILAASAGKLSGAATTTVTIRNVGDSKDRITAVVDSSGNRSAVTVDAT
jgi:hypothetical protein